MKIFIYDEFSPEDTAMMQALYSRSAESVVVHAEKVKASGSGKFMEKFYVGYGHASIADCGSTTIFIEGVSMLVAKAIEDWPLFSGQETSSRYIDMSKQLLVDPLATKESKSILDKWMKFYIENQAAVDKHLRKKFPRKDGEDENVYSKAIKARIFDTLRGFLPAGVATQFSWHTNLRQAADKLALLHHHPLAEVREVADKIYSILKGKYPSSFCHKLLPKQEEYRQEILSKFSYFGDKKLEKDFIFKTNIKNSDLAPYKNIIKNRPEKIGLPNFLADLGLVNVQFYLDFGSFRDLQRHRNGICRMPLLTTKFGFNEWYINELPKAVQEKAKKLIKEQAKAISKLKGSKEDIQYYTAMGFNVICNVSYGLPAMLYVAELRSGKMVHPTLRKIAQEICLTLKKKLPDLAIYGDFSPNDWDIRRGLNDIKEKK